MKTVKRRRVGVPDEGDGFDTDLAERRPPPGLDGLPLAVIAEGKPNNDYIRHNLDTWHELQAELAAPSTSGRLVVAPNNAHGNYRTEPELITRAVDRIVVQVRGFGDR